MSLTQQAKEMMQSNSMYLDDARIGGPIGNSIVGSLLSLTTRSPRWATERAVCEALQEIDAEEEE